MPALNAGLTTGVVVQRSGVVLMARVLGNLGTPVTRATLSTLAWKVSDLSAGAAVGSGTFTVNGTVYDALQQNDPRWTRDSAGLPGPDGAFGYNFLATLPASTFGATPLVGRADLIPAPLYQADVTFTAADASVFDVPFQWRPLGAY